MKSTLVFSIPPPLLFCICSPSLSQSHNMTIFVCLLIVSPLAVALWLPLILTNWDMKISLHSARRMLNTGHLFFGSTSLINFFLSLPIQNVMVEKSVRHRRHLVLTPLLHLSCCCISQFQSHFRRISFSLPWRICFCLVRFFSTANFASLSHNLLLFLLYAVAMRDYHSLLMQRQSCWRFMLVALLLLSFVILNDNNNKKKNNIWVEWIKLQCFLLVAWCQLNCQKWSPWGWREALHHLVGTVVQHEWQFSHWSSGTFSIF